MESRRGSYQLHPEIAALLAQPVLRRFGVVQFEEKPAKPNFRHEVLKIHMKRSYPLRRTRQDLVDCLNSNYNFCSKAYLSHKTVDQNENAEHAHTYLTHLWSKKGIQSYVARTEKNNEYRHVVQRKQYSFRKYIRDLRVVHQKADHPHFLLEILFMKNLQQYPFPRKWNYLIAFFHGMPEYERLIAAIRVVTGYDGDRAPEFEAEFY